MTNISKNEIFELTLSDLEQRTTFAYRRVFPRGKKEAMEKMAAVERCLREFIRQEMLENRRVLIRGLFSMKLGGNLYNYVRVSHKLKEHVMAKKAFWLPLQVPQKLEDELTHCEDLGDISIANLCTIAGMLLRRIANEVALNHNTVNMSGLFKISVKEKAASKRFDLAKGKIIETEACIVPKVTVSRTFKKSIVHSWEY